MSKKNNETVVTRRAPKAGVEKHLREQHTAESNITREEKKTLYHYEQLLLSLLFAAVAMISTALLLLLLFLLMLGSLLLLPLFSTKLGAII